MRDRRLAAAYTTTGLGVSAVSLIAPVLPELAARYGVDVEAMALFQSAAMIPGVVTAALAGDLGRRYGLRAVLRACLLIYGLAGASLLLVDDFTVAVLLRLVQGVGGGGLLALSFMLISTIDPGRRMRATGRNAAIVSAMMVVQPPLGSALGALSSAGPFAFYSLAVLAGVVVPQAAPRRATQGTARQAGERRGPPAAVVGTLAMAMVLNILLFGWLLLLTPLVLDAAGVDLAWRGWALAAQSAIATVTTLVTARWRDVGRFRPLLLTGWLSAVVLLGLAAAGPPLLTAALLVLAGAFFGLINPTLVGYVSGIDGGRWLGWWQSSARLGQVIGPLLAGGLYAALTAGPVLLVGAGVALVVAVATGRARPRNAARGAQGAAEGSSAG